MSKTERAKAAPATQATPASADETARVVPAIPALDDLMPALDRTGRRGRFTNRERAYRDRRTALEGVLKRLAAAEAYVGDLRTANCGLLRDLDSAGHTIQGLEADRDFWRRCYNQQLARRAADNGFAGVAMMTIASLTRLTGIEVDETEVEPGRDSVTFPIQFGGFGAEITPANYQITIWGKGRHRTTFRLTSIGKIEPLHELAILSFLGLQDRNLKEALSKDAYRLLFEESRPVMSENPIPSMLGHVAVSAFMDFDKPRTGPSDLGSRVRAYPE